jgi:hypothetical protein
MIWLGKHNHTMISTSSAAEKNASSPEPMQIDAARYKSLSQGEKDQRHREGLCFYCGIQAPVKEPSVHTW